MPVKKGDRRGRYDKGRADVPSSAQPRDIRPAVLSPTPADLAMLERLVKNSPLKDVDTKRLLAESVLTQALMLRDLRSGRELAIDEEKALNQCTYEKRKLLEALKLTDATVEDEESI